MPYLHGVYTSESPTSVVPSVNAASCLPFVIGTAPDGYTGDSLVRCRNWQEFKSAFGAAESYDGADPSTLATFARQWYKRAGAGDALFYALGGTGGTGGSTSDSSVTPVRSFEHCSLMLAETGSDNEGAVYDRSDNLIPPVDGAEYYVCREYPFVLFRVGTAFEDDVEKPAIIAPIAYREQLDLTDFTLDAYTASRTVGTVSGCSISADIVTDYGHAIVDSDGNPVSPIEGATNYKITTDDPDLANVYILIGEHEGEQCLVASVEAEVSPFDIAGFAPVDGASVTDALAALDTVYERFGLVVTVVLCPRTGIDSASEIAAKVQKFGSGWSAIGLIDLPYDWGNAAPELPLKSPYLVYCSPRCQAGSEIVDASSVVAGAMAATDASAGGFPYVSPSNKLAYIDGIVDEEGQPLFLSQPDVNDLFNANAVVSFLHNAKGWVVWGNNTGYYSPSATDPKDRWISVRRTFCYIRNDFLVFGASRIDNPINKRQLDGVVNAYNQRLKGLVGVGAVNSASIALSDRNTAETLLGGAVFVDARISPPPPMENLDATFEYDVEGFVSSLS